MNTQHILQKEIENLGATVTKLFSKLCTAVEKYNITSISAENITADMNTQAYMLKTTITFYNKFDFGGDE